jgi:tetratricopeptide (TPR) repeat protein
LNEELACYDHALEIDPSQPKVWNNRGEALGSMGRLPEAIGCFDKAIELDPRFMEAWFDKAVTLLNSGQVLDALACFEEARLLGSDRAVQIIDAIRRQLP